MEHVCKPHMVNPGRFYNLLKIKKLIAEENTPDAKLQDITRIPLSSSDTTLTSEMEALSAFDHGVQVEAKSTHT